MKLFGEKKGQTVTEQPATDGTELIELRAKVARLERVVKLLDYDLQDAIDGFYRRRQADRMRDVRDEDAQKKKRERPSDRDILLRALELDKSSVKTRDEE